VTDTRPARRLQLNKLCEIEDFRVPARIEVIRALEPQMRFDAYYPLNFEHRKGWEYAQLIGGLRQLQAINSDSMVLSVAAGHETPVFALTNEVRYVFATDIYGTGSFAGRESTKSVLVDSDAFARVPYNRNRLVVAYMNALELHFEDGMFDVVFSLSSIEHFGGFEGCLRSLTEMHRVLKPGGIAMLTTECIVNGKASRSTPGVELFSPADLHRLFTSVPGLVLVEPINFDISELTLAGVRNWQKVLEDLEQNHADYPHLVLDMDGWYFTSASVFLRKEAVVH
jgi:SAM-dependent methyltransferase